MKLLIAIDPGLDDTGVAAFDIDAYEVYRQSQVAPPKAALRSFLWSRVISTSPRLSIEDRLPFLSRDVARLVWGTHDYAPIGPIASVVVVEMPASTGSYGKNRNNHRALSGLWMAIGAIIGALDGIEVWTVPADRRSKTTRHQELLALAPLCKVSLPTGPRGGKRLDELDAIWLGWIAMMGHTESAAERSDQA
jgi:hypothetical protein